MKDDDAKKTKWVTVRKTPVCDVLAGKPSGIFLEEGVTVTVRFRMLGIYALVPVSIAAKGVILSGWVNRADLEPA